MTPELREITEQQRTILTLKANGKTTDYIAAFLNTSPHAVEWAIRLTYRVYGTANIANTIAVAIAVGDIGIHEIIIPTQESNAV